MPRSTQTMSGLKLVILFDRRNETCCVCSHNLDAEDASQELAELRRDGLPAFTVDQRSRHTQADPDECPACRYQGVCLLSSARNGQPDSAVRPPLEQSTNGASFCSSLPENLNPQILEVCHVD